MAACKSLEIITNGWVGQDEQINFMVGWVQSFFLYDVQLRRTAMKFAKLYDSRKFCFKLSFLQKCLRFFLLFSSFQFTKMKTIEGKSLLKVHRVFVLVLLFYFESFDFLFVAMEAEHKEVDLLLLCSNL